MPSLILGTAGHIDHGKTALVEALTGVDTDRLKEEKARGITIELGFAQLTVGDHRFGVVDVPGHEAFIRAMVAGATGMDVVLLAVAADEGVMPQTREHLAIVRLLGVRELVVALTKSDLSDPEWRELVAADVTDTLAEHGYEDVPIVETSATSGEGLDALTAELSAAAERAEPADVDGPVRLPVDRAFTIQGTGTVVTGTLWSGRLRVGDRVRVVPGTREGRVRGIEVHGESAAEAVAGDRVAVALTGEGGDRDVVQRGSTLVADPNWPESRMLTARLRLLPDTGWSVEHNQRVHVHIGTSEVLARCALLQDEALGPGDVGWVQLRLEEPVMARSLDRFVVRAYSPVTTIAGGIVAEAFAEKRRRLSETDLSRVTAVLDGSPEEALTAALSLAGWTGLPQDRLRLVTGVAAHEMERAVTAASEGGALFTQRHGFGAEVVSEGAERVVATVEQGHRDDPLRAGTPLSAVRASLPSWAEASLADAVLARLVEEGSLEVVDGAVRRAGFTPELNRDQTSALESVVALLEDSGLAPPFAEEFPGELRDRSDFRSLLRHLESGGRIVHLGDGLYVGTEPIEEAVARVRSTLGGQSALGPADFREALPVSRKHLIPLLNHLDGLGVTIKGAEGRDVPGDP